MSSSEDEFYDVFPHAESAAGRSASGAILSSATDGECTASTSLQKEAPCADSKVIAEAAPSVTPLVPTEHRAPQRKLGQRLPSPVADAEEIHSFSDSPHDRRQRPSSPVAKDSEPPVQDRSPLDRDQCQSSPKAHGNDVSQQTESPRPFVQQDDTQSKRSPPVSPAASVLSSGWGGVFSALGTLRSGLYDIVDGGHEEESTAPRDSDPSPQNEGERFKALVEDMAPEPSVLDGIDRTLDYATDRLGRALIGSFRSFGLALETVSPGPQADDEHAESAHDTPSMAAGVVSAGISTLERIGRRTAGIVLSARDRMAASPAGGLYALAPVSRDELRGRTFDGHFAAAGGPAALEGLQVASSTAAVAAKTMLRSLPTEDAAAAQDTLRGVNLDAGEAAAPSVGASVPWASIPLREPCPEALAELDSLPPTPAEAAAHAESLGALVYDAELPPEPAALLVFLARRRAAVVAAACIRVLLAVDCLRLLSQAGTPAAAVSLLADVVSASLGGILGAQQYAKAADVLSPSRQEALMAQIVADVDAASSTVRDAATAFASVLRGAALKHATSRAVSASD